MNSIAEQIREIFPSMDRSEYIAWIGEIQEQLCPTCLENQDFNPNAECDCLKRPKYVSAEDIYEGRCEQDVAEHWIGALKDAKGALKQIALMRNRPWDSAMRKPFYDVEFREAFTLACKEAQMAMALGRTWQDVGFDVEAVELRIGMAYKFADPEDWVYAEMASWGRED